MAIKYKTGKCPECEGETEVSLIAGRCRFHYWKHRSEINAKKNPEPAKKKLYRIPKKSKAQRINEGKYIVKRSEFLSRPENRICPITGQKTTDVHHMKGRVGDLFLDERFWLALSREGHRKVEENPEWAKENGYSLSRLKEED